LKYVILFTFLFLFSSFHPAEQPFDLIIRNGKIYDGLGGSPYIADIGIRADTIAFIGDLKKMTGKKELNANGLAVAPGFINMLSWAGESLVKDGRSMSDLKQGVTLEVFGEGWSPAPRTRTRTFNWSTVKEYFNYIEHKGVSTNFATFVGATTVRSLVIGNDNRKPDSLELAQMKKLVEQAMKDGAMGVGSSLIYAPADYASTEELIELCKVASQYGGMYITHMRSESDKIFPALKEVFTISKEAKIQSEIYHLKINNTWNWNKIDTVLYKIDSAQKAGLKISANMYTYNASGTGLVARLPTWVQDGGGEKMRQRLKDPVIRKKVIRDLELGIPSRNSDPKDVMIMGFRKDSLNKLYKSKRLSEIADLHGKNANETMIDLLVADKSGIPSIFFLISEENVKRMLKLPFVSICSDASSNAAEKPFTDEGAHPRMYGSFARFLGKYVRDEKLMSLEEGIRRLTSLPASNLKIKKRGSLKVGNYADVVLFDSATIRDNATFENPHQYATGVHHVIVNGQIVLRDGVHTGAMPGRAVRGMGYSIR
jgi:N-acyl-D-amino-acid deacylase